MMRSALSPTSMGHGPLARLSGLLVIGLTAASVGVIGGTGAAPATAAPGSPGIPSDPPVLYQEDFENGAGVQTLTGYTGASGATYTADPYWLETSACNGIILNALDAAPPGYCVNDVGGVEWPSAQDKTYALGLLNSPADPPRIAHCRPIPLPRRRERRSHPTRSNSLRHSSWPCPRRGAM